MIIRFIFFIFLMFFLNACDDKKAVDDISDDLNDTKNQESYLSENLFAPFNLNLNNGKILTLKKTKTGFEFINNNKNIMFFFLTENCTPCNAQISLLNNLQERYKDDLDIIGIVLKAQNLDEFLKEMDIKFSISLNNESLLKHFDDITQIPFMILYHKNGDYFRHYRGIIAEEMLDKEILRME
ncbi:redoxin domain-containing protein [Campylobacter sp. FMV-PI01]|uniref:Redoxin domain-containing protein n=1 Tax=Campylobacter portucalensis TaxID=2608384 RepID=A0A6L5WGC8_9BACT|nr:thioredoxin-like domain-containing protein [Campylobacter portucalensis]MSN95826.1 redoxin domain-containing protein [Campylobacter portucalensis]